MKASFDEVIRQCYNIPEPQTEELFAQWQNGKHRFLKAFGDKTIWESAEKVVFKETTETIKKRIDDFVRFLKEICYFELADFVVMNKDTFIHNKISYIPLEKQDIIPKDMKLLKAFKFFVDESESLYLTKIQDKASQIIQQVDKVEGKLCLSVHPLDYLTISENQNNWTTCHSMKNSYCAGNLSYMADSATVICYLKSEEDVQLPNFPKDMLWNNKKWRFLLYFSENDRIIFASKQYPFPSEAGLKIALDTINEVFSKSASMCRYGDWTDFAIKEVDTPHGKQSLISPYLIQNNNLVPIDKLFAHFPRELHYNDVLYGSGNNLRYTTLNSKFFNDLPLYWIFNGESAVFQMVNVGQKVKCLRCGKDEIVPVANDVLCFDCQMKYGKTQTDVFRNCVKCGKRLYLKNENSFYWIDDEEVICADCFKSSNYEVCDCCGVALHKSEMIQDGDKYYCKLCYNDVLEIRGEV